MKNDVAVPVFVEKGKISKYVEVTELIIRTVIRHGVTPEMDGGSPCTSDTETPDWPEVEERIQGRMINRMSYRLSCIQYDISFYDSAGSFLGLTRSRFMEESELGVDDHLSIDMRTDWPDDTVRCVFNVGVKRAGFLARFFWG